MSADAIAAWGKGTRPRLRRVVSPRDFGGVRPRCLAAFLGLLGAAILVGLTFDFLRGSSGSGRGYAATALVAMAAQAFGSPRR